MLEEWKLSRKGGWFIPFHIQSQCYHSGAEEKESCRVVLGNLCECFLRERERMKEDL